MRVYLQWTRANPQDWELVNITSDRDWRDAIKGAGGVPDGTEVITDDPQWIYDLEVQGVQMSGADHIHIDVDGGSLIVTRWNDDPADWAGDEYAQQWTFRLPVMDGRVGKLQPRQSLTVWAADAARRAKYMGQSIGSGEWHEPIAVYGWDQFTAPGPANQIVHGIWIEGRDDVADPHTGVREVAASGTPTEQADGTVYEGETPIAVIKDGIEYAILVPSHGPQPDAQHLCTVCGRYVTHVDRHEVAKTAKGWNEYLRVGG